LYIEKTALPGVVIVHSEEGKDVFFDERGSFSETYNKTKFAHLGVADDFVQDNWSLSGKGVVRGLHYQLKRPQAKLCRVIQGAVQDIVVDIRIGSPHRNKWISVPLSANDQKQIYIPAGFAHGFLALDENTQFLYKCSDFHDPLDEKGILWSDSDLAIRWAISDPMLSRKDRGHRALVGVPEDDLPRYPRGGQ
jgi:dTDP-4-dehydrorhamnose 3,5-epimerase